MGSTCSGPDGVVEQFGCCRGGSTGDEVVSNDVLKGKNGKLNGNSPDHNSIVKAGQQNVSNTFINNNFNVLQVEKFTPRDPYDLST